MKELQDRILQVSKDLQLSHIGSCLSVLPVLVEIYANKEPGDLVILDNAHAHLAHLVVRALFEIDDQFGETTSRELDVEHLMHTYGIHCEREAGCDVSGGSLGHGLGIGIGLAMTDLRRKVYVVVSDGSMHEGSNWEALRIKDALQLKNLVIYTNFNGFSAVATVDCHTLQKRMEAFCDDIQFRYTTNGSDFVGVEGHYKTI